MVALAHPCSSPCAPENAYPPISVHITGLRYYSPELGRWVSRDPIGEDGGENLYGFASCSPVLGVDPVGLAPAMPRGSGLENGASAIECRVVLVWKDDFLLLDLGGSWFFHEYSFELYGLAFPDGVAAQAFADLDKPFGQDLSAGAGNVVNFWCDGQCRIHPSGTFSNYDRDPYPPPVVISGIIQNHLVEAKTKITVTTSGPLAYSTMFARAEYHGKLTLIRKIKLPRIPIPIPVPIPFDKDVVEPAIGRAVHACVPCQNDVTPPGAAE